MPQNCISFGCPNTSSKSSDISFHLLPLTNKEVLAKWILNIRKTHTPVNKHVKICSEHFDPSCFLISYNGRKMLKKNTILRSPNQLKNVLPLNSDFLSKKRLRRSTPTLSTQVKFCLKNLTMTKVKMVSFPRRTRRQSRVRLKFSCLSPDIA